MLTTLLSRSISDNQGNDPRKKIDDPYFNQPSTKPLCVQPISRMGGPNGKVLFIFFSDRRISRQSEDTSNLLYLTLRVV